MNFRKRMDFQATGNLNMTPVQLRRYYAEAARETQYPIAAKSAPESTQIIDPHKIITDADRNGQMALTRIVEDLIPGAILFGEEVREVWGRKNEKREPTAAEQDYFKQQEIAFYKGERAGPSVLCDSLDGTLLYRIGCTDFAIMLSRYEGAQMTDASVHFPARKGSKTINADIGAGKIYIDDQIVFQRDSETLLAPRCLGIHFIERLSQTHKDEVRARFADQLEVPTANIVEEYHMGPGALHYTGSANDNKSVSAILFWAEGPDGDKDRNWSNKPWDTMPYHGLTEAFGGQHGNVLTGAPYSMASTCLYPAAPLLFARRPEFWGEVAEAALQVRANLGL